MAGVWSRKSCCPSPGGAQSQQPDAGDDQRHGEDLHRIEDLPESDDPNSRGHDERAADDEGIANRHRNAAGEELMASLAGFPENIVRDMDGAVDGFLKDVAEFWTRVVKLSLGNGRSVLVAAAAAAPDLATAVGEAQRSARPDAAVQAEGLTFFGGGAVAVSELASGEGANGTGRDVDHRPDDELGTTDDSDTPTTFAADGGSGPYFEYDDDGEDRESDPPASQVVTEATSETRVGWHVLIGGGALLGAAGMPGAAAALTALAKEALAVQLAKAVSYAGFLKSQQDRSSAAAGVLARLQTRFLHLKHNVEREILLGAVDDHASEADVERTLRMLDRVYHWLRKND